MRKLLIVLFTLLVSVSYAQNPTYQDKLYYTCKVWGFIKYYHSEVSVCNVNWDSVLRDRLPAIKAAVTNDDFNNELSNIIKAAGPMALATIPLPDTLLPDRKRNRNFGWLNDPMLRADVKADLETIKDNFLPHNICWVERGTSGWLNFPHDNPALDVHTANNYPDEINRLVMLFKYWNIINYYNANNYVTDRPWDSTLYEYGPLFAQANTRTTLLNLVERMSHDLNDAHAEGLTWVSDANKFYRPRLVLSYAQNEYVVVKSGVTNVAVGDVIVSIDGLTTGQWEDSLRPYISAGNESVFRRFMCNSMLATNQTTNVTIEVKDASGNIKSVNLPRVMPGSAWIADYYINDSLKNVKWTTLNCNTGYVNMGKLQKADVKDMYNDLEFLPVIIFDIRSYPNGTGWDIVSLMYPDVTTFAKGTIPDITYPGTYNRFEAYLGQRGNNGYKGKVIVLFNENSQSQAEYSSMMLEALPDVTKIGSQTAGTDGDISRFKLTQDINTGLTSLGIYYPNGDSTQRIGIVPDIIAKPTIAGIRQGRDEVLETAIATACKWLSIPETSKREAGLKLYPNPVSQTLSIEASTFVNNKVTIQVINLVGQILMTKETDAHTAIVHLNTESLAPGMYLLHIKAGTEEYHTRFTRQ